MKNRYKDRIATIISEPDRDDFLYSTDIISKIVKMFENILANYNNRMWMFSDCLKARNENENIISSDTVRKILEHYSTVYDENQKRIEKKENINIEYNFREVFLFLLSIDVAMEYEKIHVIRMANI